MDEKMRDLLDKTKLTACLAADTAIKAAGVVSQKGGQLMDKAKRNLHVFDLNNEIELLMREIGRMVYLTHTGAEADEDALEKKLLEIDGKYAEIAELKKELEAEKTGRCCPVCGNKCEKTDIYCSVCGEKLE